MNGIARGARALIAVAAAVVLLPGLLTACSGSPENDPTGSPSAKVASLGDCMREKGYDMPDPKTGSDTMQLSAPDGVDEDQYGADLGKCLDADGGAGEAGGAKPAGGPEAAEIAGCIREEGFADYPDDQDGQSKYQPDDEQAFQQVSNQCAEQAFGSGATSEER